MKEGFEKGKKRATPESVDMDEIADPYEGWSDEKRMEEWTETGNPKCLTLDLAVQMGVPYEVLKEVPGFTEDAFRDMLESQDEKIRISEEVILASHGADNETLRNLPLEEGVRRLLSLAGVRQKTVYDDDVERVRFIAFDRLCTFLREKEGAVSSLFGQLRFSEPEGLRDIAVIEDLYKAIHRDFVMLSHTSGDEISESEKLRGHSDAQALNEFVEVSRAFVNGAFIAETNYLFAERARAFAFGVCDLSEELDFEKFATFEITKGIYATFSEDGTRLYVGKVEDTAYIEGLIGHAGPIRSTETGQYLARYRHEVVPKELWDARKHILDTGESIDSIFASYGIEDEELVYDYIALMQSPSRKVLESDFGIELRTLSLREQFYLLKYLKHTQVGDVGAVQDFVHQYEIDGMRTFLACAEEPDLDEKIMEFAATKDTAVVQKIFATYGALISAADEAETFVRTTIECEEAECNQVAHRVRTNMLARAQRLLSSAVRTEDPVAIAEKLAHFQIAGTLFAGAFKALKEQGQVLNWEHIKNSSFERVSSQEITKEDRMQMEKIWESYYAGKYDSKELEDSLRQDFMASYEKENVHFYLFKYKGNVASFFLSETVGEDAGRARKHLASFMTSQSFEGGGLGLAVMEKGLEEEQKGAVLVGESDVDPVRTPIVSKYFEQYGFIATRAYDDHGEPTLALERWEDDRFTTQEAYEGNHFCTSWDTRNSK